MSSGPVYSLVNFRKSAETELCYVNRFSKHLRTHKFVNSPHRHDFFLVIFITAGTGTHSIDFVEYQVKPYCVFVMQPGQIHKWKLSPDVEGFVCFHSREFYEASPNSHLLNELPFYRTAGGVPFCLVARKHASILERHFEELLAEYDASYALRGQKLRVYLNSLYLDIARIYGPEGATGSNRYMVHLRSFQDLLEKQFIENRSPESYAGQLGLTVKHLNRVTKELLGKTATRVIAERLVLEAKRLLAEHTISISDVAYRLNFSDVSYFTRFFRKHTGVTPLIFAKKIR